MTLGGPYGSHDYPLDHRWATRHRSARSRGSPRTHPVQVDQVGPAHGGPPGEPPGGSGVPGHRGARAEEAAPMDRSRHRARVRHVGLHHPGPHHHRDRRCGVPVPGVRHPDHRPVAGRRFHRRRLHPAGHHRPGDLRRHPAADPAGQAGPLLALLRLPHRRRVARAVHDLQRDLDAVGLARGSVQRLRVHPRGGRVRPGLPVP